MDIAEVLKRAKAPERTVVLFLDADLAAEHDDLNRQLLAAQQAGGGTMRASTKTGELAKRIRDLEERMQSSAVTFRMRGLSAFRRDEWFAANPPREGKEESFNPVTGLPSLIAACCVDPEMTPEQAQQLCEQIGTGQADRLFSAAFEATNGAGEVPFSVAASATLRASEQKQK